MCCFMQLAILYICMQVQVMNQIIHHNWRYLSVDVAALKLILLKFIAGALLKVLCVEAHSVHHSRSQSLQSVYIFSSSHNANTSMTELLCGLICNSTIPSIKANMHLFVFYWLPTTE